MATKPLKNFSAKFGNQNLLLKSLIGVSGLMFLLLGACIFYIVQIDMHDRTRYSVKNFTPQGEVPQRVDFSITFSEMVIDKSQVGTEVPAEALRFTPAVQGTARWIARDRVDFFLDAPLAPSAQYTVQLTPKLNPSETFQLTGQKEFKFATDPFAVQQAWMEFTPDDAHEHTTGLGTIVFNYPVTIVDLKAHLSIKLDDKTEIPYQIETHTVMARRVRFETERIKRGTADQKIKIKIEKGFKCTGGKIGVEKASIIEVILQGRGTLGVTYSNVRNSGGTPYISVTFSAPVLSDAIEPYIELTPTVAYQVSSNYRNVNIHGNFKRGTNYTLKILQGLTTRNGAVLKQDYMNHLRIPNIPPQLRFLGDGFFLARKGQLNLGLATINVKGVKLNIEKVFANNLIYASKLDRWSRSSRNLGKFIQAEELDISSQLNEEVTTPISLEEYLSDEHVGIFKVVAQNTQRRWDTAYQWVLITDLGISAKWTGDNLYVWVKSLATGSPVPRARVKLISDNNQTLLDGTTNWAGYAEFTDVTQKTEDFTPFMITVSKRDDLAFIQLNRHRIGTADFNIAGSAYLQKGYEAFLYTSRGVYRPGETVQLAGIVRGPKQVTPQPLPARIEVLSPNGRIMRELRLQTNKNGACDVQILIPDYALTGNYIAKMRIADRVVGRVQFQVEEFMPDRMKVAVTADKSTYKLGEELGIEVSATNLFGPPAVGRKVEVFCELEATPLVKKDTALNAGATQWDSFVFGNDRSNFEKQRIGLGEAKTNTEGKAYYQFTVPETLKAPSLLNGSLTATVSEAGGRSVTASHRVVIHPYSHYVGLRRTTTAAVINQPLRFDYIAVNDAMTIASGRDLKLSLYKVRWNTILRQNSAGRYEYISEPQTTEVETVSLTSAETVQTVTLTPSDYGEYRVRLEDIVSTATVELRFYVGGRKNIPVSMKHPTRLELTLNKPAYRPGQTAELYIKAPFPGKLLLTVEREKVLSYRTIIMKTNTTTLSIPVRSAYRPNVYLSATLVRAIPMEGPMTNNKSPLPARAFGVIPLKIDETRRRLSIEMSLHQTNDAGDTQKIPLTSQGRNIESAEVSQSEGSEVTVLPNNEVTIAFRVHGRRSWQKYNVCIAAVDEGILALTHFKTPNPYDYFYRQRGLKTRSYDLYGGILPEIANVTDSSSTGGDAPTTRQAERRKRLSTGSIRRVKPISLWSGFVETDGNGRGTVQFKIPQFNGTLRLMAVAFAGGDYGGTEAYLTVREPIVLTPTFPRFLAGGDKVRVPVTLFNGTEEEGVFKVELQASGDVRLLSASEVNPLQASPQEDSGSPLQTLETENKVDKLTVAKRVNVGAEAQVFFEILVQDAIGKATFNLSAHGNTQTTQQEVEIPMRSVAPPITKTGQGVVRAGEPVDFIFPSNLIPNSSEFNLTLSPFPSIRFADSLRYLIRYPHGCLEQTTSRVFPLLYFSDLARSVEPMLAAEDSVDYYITSGITKIESMLQSEDRFAYWPGGYYVSPWSSIYASHFLVEARKAGYEVADRVYDAMLRGLKAQAKFSPNKGDENEAKAIRDKFSLATYAAYVLAAAGHPDRGTMNYLKNRGLSGLNHYSHFQLAGAFALSGELETALSILPVSISPNFNKGNGQRETGGTFDTPIRAQAIMLDVLAEVNKNHPSIPMLVQNLSEAASEGNRWATTQENAFAFLALGKILKKQMDRNYTGILRLNGEHFADFDATETRYADKAWDGARVQLSVKGEGSCYYYWSAFGIQRDSFIEEYERELQVRRRYFNKEGEERTDTFVHGELLIAEVNVKALTANLENVVVVDMLPTGFEIENPRLESREGIPWLKARGFKPDYIDIRDDRFIFFGTFPRQRERKFYYTLRAVTQGEFTLPPIVAEAMYDTTKSAVTGSRRIAVVTE